MPERTAKIILGITGKKNDPVATAKNIMHAVNNGLLENTFMLQTPFLINFLS
jgi:hypothetical protein